MALIPIVLCITAAHAQEPAVRAALEQLRADNAWTVDQQISICEIPAPPFNEGRRAAEYRRRLEALGLSGVRIDSVGNVIAERRGRGPLADSVVVLSGHLDTVFPESTDVRVRREGARLLGPGIGDDCRGLATVLAVARVLQRHRIQTDRTIAIVGTVGEEGAGNLRGVRHLVTRELAGRITSFITVDGIGLGMTSNAVGSHRYRVTFSGPGGHSYSAFGMPNPIHAMGRALAKIAELRVPDAPRTTFNAGIVAGGTSVNAISARATFDMDLRSESPEALNALDSAFRRVVHEALAEERARWPGSDRPLELAMDTIGVRPAGSQAADAPIVRAAREAASRLGFTPEDVAQSTDANLPMSRGIPSLAMDAGGSGGGFHQLSEWYEDGDRGWLGPQWVLLTVLALARR